ncbi:MAG TPA: phosphoribosyltransferase family protein [Nitrososphaeraceae archaeon]|nr:phosphoribosyltransferase family protein [Nitrososphaeraceae archaeon]
MKRVLFQNREEAARLLANELEWLKGEKIDANNLSLEILAIPRGGVVTGHVIASILGGKLDILISQKIVSPYNLNITIGAVMHDGSSYSLTKYTGRGEDTLISIPRRYIDEQVSHTVKEIERRLERFRGNYTYSLKNKTVLLVDDGIASGATMFAAAQWVTRQKPKELIVAVPVAPRESVDKLSHIADRVIVIHCCSSYDNVGEHYTDFTEVRDDEVERIIKKSQSNRS